MKNQLFLLLSVIFLSVGSADAKTRKKEPKAECLICSPLWHRVHDPVSGETIGKWRNCSWGRETRVYHQ
jgi:hypothetical protein